MIFSHQRFPPVSGAISHDAVIKVDRYSSELMDFPGTFMSRVLVTFIARRLQITVRVVWSCLVTISCDLLIVPPSVSPCPYTSAVRCPKPFSPLFHLNLPGYIIGKGSVSLSIDSLSGLSWISASTVYKLNLPCIFDNAGLQHSAIEIKVFTTGGSYFSILDLLVPYGLPSGVVLGSDWSIPC